jgi:hypothetical protein
LYASGLIAAGGIMGLVGVVIKLYEGATGHELHLWFPVGSLAYRLLYHQWLAVMMFVLLGFSLYYFARKPMKKE